IAGKRQDGVPDAALIREAKFGLRFVVCVARHELDADMDTPVVGESETFRLVGRRALRRRDSNEDRDVHEEPEHALRRTAAHGFPPNMNVPWGSCRRSQASQTATVARLP